MLKHIMVDADDTLISADTIKVLKAVMDERNMDCVYGKFLEENEDGSIYPHEVHMVWMNCPSYSVMSMSSGLIAGKA